MIDVDIANLQTKVGREVPESQSPQMMLSERFSRFLQGFPVFYLMVLFFDSLFHYHGVAGCVAGLKG